MLRSQLELTQLKQEIERRVGEKDEEIESLRKNQQRQLGALQHSLDAEVKAKNDQVKQRKMVESQVDDMQSSLDDHEKVCASFYMLQSSMDHPSKCSYANCYCSLFSTQLILSLQFSPLALFSTSPSYLQYFSLQYLSCVFSSFQCSSL